MPKSEELFAVREMFRPAAESMFSVQNRQEMALVRGRRCPIVGAVSMDYCTLDVGHVPGVEVGDAVAELDVRSAPGHVRCNCHRSFAACLSYDLRFAFMVLRVKNIVLDTDLCQHLRLWTLNHRDVGEHVFGVGHFPGRRIAMDDPGTHISATLLLD